MTAEMVTCGGWSSEEVVTPKVTKICLEVESVIKKMFESTFITYIPLSFRIQIVAGANYVVKVYIDVNKCVHAAIFEALECNGGQLTVNAAHIESLSAPLVPPEHV